MVLLTSQDKTSDYRAI